MPGFTYLTDHEARSFQTVPSDPDCDELLQELRQLSGREWLVGIQTFHVPQGIWPWRRPVPLKLYTLYLDCHGEYQVINLVKPRGGVTFEEITSTRAQVMNYMLGHIAADQASRRERQAEEGSNWLWYGEDEDGTVRLTFGRWPRHACQRRYKVAAVQATEHDRG